MAGQDVLRRLLAGESWAQVVGVHHFGGGYGGAGHEYRFESDRQGLFALEGKERRLLKPAQVMERALQYRPKEAKSTGSAKAQADSSVPPAIAEEIHKLHTMKESASAVGVL